MSKSHVPVGAGAATPSKDDACGAGRSISGRALKTIEGERRAGQYMVRLRAQQVDPDELAVIVSMLYGDVLRGFCRAIEKELEARHG